MRAETDLALHRRRRTRVSDGFATSSIPTVSPVRCTENGTDAPFWP